MNRITTLKKYFSSRSLHALIVATATSVLLGFAGCAQISTLTGPDEAHQVGVLVAGAQAAARKPADEQRRELAAATDSFNRERSPAARLRLALLLAQPGSAINDDARALALLEPYAAANPNGGALVQLGSLLQAQVADRIREQKRAQQLKEQIDALRAVDRNLMERGQTRNR
jgi:hypothetical protein